MDSTTEPGAGAPFGQEAAGQAADEPTHTTVTSGGTVESTAGGYPADVDAHRQAADELTQAAAERAQAQAAESAERQEAAAAGDVPGQPESRPAGE